MPETRPLSTILKGAVPTVDAVHVEAIQNRVRSRRVQRRRVLVGALACITAATGIFAISVRNESVEESRLAAEPDNRGPEQLGRLPIDASNVVVGPGGSIWALVAIGGNENRQAVHQLDRGTGKSLRSVEVKGPATFMASSARFLWIGGGGDGAEPNGVLSVIDPTAGTVVAEQSVTGGGPVGFAFSSDTAWITTGAAGEVWRVELVDGKLRRKSIHLGSQTDKIVRLDDGAIWVHEGGGRRIVGLDPESLSVIADVAWPGVPLIASGGSRAWAHDPAGHIVEVDLAQIDSFKGPEVVQKLPTLMFFGSVVSAPGRLWVHRDGVERWDLPVVPGKRPQKAPGRDVSFLADVDGTAWFVRGDGGGLWRWRPGSSNDAPAPQTFETGREILAARKGKVLVFVHNDATDDQLAAIRVQLDKHAADGDVTFIDHDGAYAEYAAMFEDDDDMLRRTNAADLPRSFRLKPRSSGDLQELVRDVKGLPGVKELVCPDNNPCPA